MERIITKKKTTLSNITMDYAASNQDTIYLDYGSEKISKVLMGGTEAERKNH